MKQFLKILLVTIWVVIGDELDITMVYYGNANIGIEIMAMLGFWSVFWILVVHNEQR